MNRIEKRYSAIRKLGGWSKVIEGRIVSVCFRETAVGDAAARLLEGLTDVTELSIDDTEWNDQAMKYVEELHALTDLSLTAPKTTDAALASIGKLANLQNLSLPCRRLTGSSLLPLTGLLHLQQLAFAQCRLAKGCLAPLASLPRLVDLQLNACKGVDAALGNSKGFSRLETLDLAVSDVSDLGLAHIPSLLKLKQLNIAHAKRLTAEGLTNLHSHAKLRRLTIAGLEVDEQVIRNLCEALPNCDVVPLPEAIDQERQAQRRQAALALPKPRLPDFQAWIERARSFCRDLKNLGGEIDVLEFSAEPPATAKELDDIDDSLRNPLPASLRAFFEKGTRFFNLCFEWNSPAERLTLLQRFFPGEDEHCMHVSIGPLSVLAKYQADCIDYAQNSWLQEFPKEQGEWLRAVPFLFMPNGDFLALDPEPDPSDPPVLYLCHDGENRILARNLAAFLRDWEGLRYLGPEIWTIKDFCDRRTGCLNSKTAKAQAWRDIFE